jgi:anti-sigma factor RsiW
MNRPDHSTYREWLNLEIDGCLPPGQQAQMEAHLSSCPECRAEREKLRALGDLLRRSTIQVPPDFSERVMAALPAAGWEARHPRTWSFPAAVFLLLGAIAAGVLGSGSPRLGSLYALAVAVAGMLRAVVVAGAGLLAASWRGVGMVVADQLSSPISLTAFAILVLCLNLLLISLLRRRRGSEAQSEGARSSRHRSRR